MICSWQIAFKVSEGMSYQLGCPVTCMIIKRLVLINLASNVHNILIVANDSKVVNQ